MCMDDRSQTFSKHAVISGQTDLPVANTDRAPFSIQCTDEERFPSAMTWQGKAPHKQGTNLACRQ